MDDAAGDEPADTREALMRATFRALREHGYADLSIQRIADEFEKSKSLIYYHYDDKDALLLDFLDYMREQFTERTSETIGDDDLPPDEHLWHIYEHLFPDGADEDRANFLVALFELRTKAPYNDDYRERFTRMDELIKNRFAAVVDAGTESGVFRDVDPDATAEFLLSAFNGAMMQFVTTDLEDRASDHREGFRAYIDEFLRAD